MHFLHPDLNPDDGWCLLLRPSDCAAKVMEESCFGFPILASEQCNMQSDSGKKSFNIAAPYIEDSLPS